MNTTLSMRHLSGDKSGVERVPVGRGDRSEHITGSGVGTPRHKQNAFRSRLSQGPCVIQEVYR